MKLKYSDQKRFFLNNKGKKAIAVVPGYDGIVCGYKKDIDGIILLQDKPDKGLRNVLNSYIAPEYRNHPNGYLYFKIKNIIII